jgi:hypothetical protein
MCRNVGSSVPDSSRYARRPCSIVGASEQDVTPYAFTASAKSRGRNAATGRTVECAAW